MSVLSVMAVTLAPLGILSHVVTRRIPGYNENEVQVRLFRRGSKCVVTILKALKECRGSLGREYKVDREGSGVV